MAGGLQTHSADFRVVPWRPAVVLATVRVSESGEMGSTVSPWTNYFTSQNFPSSKS